MQKTTHKVINFTISGLIGLVALGVGEYAFVRFAPVSTWIAYYEVTPSKEVFSIGEEITFVSKSETRVDVDMEYEDILRCDGKYYSVYESSRTDKPAGESEGVWVYQGAVPLYKAQCELESNISACPGFGICKPFRVEGDQFSIK